MSTRDVASAGGTRGFLTPAVWLVALAAAFLAARVPVMYRQPGGQDEDSYAVPGLAILESGIPRLPHAPARNPESVFYRADVALFSEPPLYFYWQALFYALFADVYGTARLSSAVAGVILTGLVYGVSREFGAPVRASLWGAGLLLWSRWFYFPSICARPDMLCAVFGFAAILSVSRWLQTRTRRPLLLTGVLIGLGGLTHPFAIVYAIQIGVWVAAASRRWGRLANLSLLTAVSLLVFSLWLPLIAMYPDIFRVQFRNQFLGDAVGSIWQRAILPGPSIVYHMEVLWTHLGAIQFLMVALGLAGSSLVGWRNSNRGLLTVSLLTWSSIYLMSVAVGPHHQVIGYWVYPGALGFICLGMFLQQIVEFAVPGTESQSGTATESDLQSTQFVHLRRRRVAGVLSIAMLLLLLPGSGLRALAAYAAHWDDLNYDAPRFARQLLRELPPDRVYAVDAQFLLDFVAADRHTLAAQTVPAYFQVDQFDFDYLIVSRYGTESGIVDTFGGELIRTEGVKDDPFACYAEIHRVQHRAADSPTN